MVTRWTRWLTRLRRALGRDEWAIRLLGMPPFKTNGTEPGLVLIQIDGLSRTQLQRALASGRMPRLRRLLTTESYRLHSLYSGLPSSTPSVQGELFYGVRSIVPAFSFRDPATGQVVTMLDAEAAKRVEDHLAEHAAGLLEGGSSYANIYTGGASEAHYCSTNIGWGEALRVVNPLRIVAAAVLHTTSFFRVTGLLLLEAVLASLDFVRGSLRGHSFWRELLCIPQRVGVTVLLRELCVFGACADVTRGVPIVHLNLLGYDEQAHRRGPSSAFAHWSLKGIDNAINRIWKASHRSCRRHYDVWIYSDHGQEACIPYERIAGRTLQQAVEELIDYPESEQRNSTTPLTESRSAWLGRGFLFKWLRRPVDDGQQSEQSSVQVAANGPLGFIYFNRSHTVSQKRELAERLVAEAECPLVLMKDESGVVEARSWRGCSLLQEDPAELLGANHPFLREVTADLEKLARHPLAGDLIVAGWSVGGKSVSFAGQNGSHAGPGPDETLAFALLPSDIPLGHSIRSYPRANDLRVAALRQLRRKPAVASEVATSSPVTTDSISLLSYNVHGCVGMDGQLSPERIARVIARSGADVVALQELDARRGRSQFQDQAQEIAKLLEMDWHFHPAWTLEEEQYGDAVLSRLPMRLARAGVLPGQARLGSEPRGALWVEITLGERRVQIVNTHLGLRHREQVTQVADLMGENWLQAAAQNGPAVLCGDFNFSPRSRLYRRVTNQLRDGYDDVGGPRPAATYSSWGPLLRIDHLFVSHEWHVSELGVVRTSLSRNASDHLPLLAKLQFAGTTTQG